MKYLVFNRKSMLFTTLLFSMFGGLNAQIESTHTDEKYNYTTVVYKDKAATDKDVLTALDNSIGMGDVIRVTVAPPKPAVVPVADKTKGEDTWLKPVKMPVNTMTAATAAMPINAVPASAAAAPKAARSGTVAMTAPVAAKPVAKPVTMVPSPVVVPDQKQEADAIAESRHTGATKSSVSTRTSKSSKSTVRKSSKKSGKSYKVKNRKKGKQRYSCPKF